MAVSDRQRDQFRELVRGAGLRATKSRLAVLSILAERSVPLSHAEVTEALAGEDWDRATLYRNLTDLTEVGLLRRFDLGDRVWRFELASSKHNAESMEHPHFLCTECGDVQCLPTLQLHSGDDVPRALASGSVAIQVRGRCDACDGVQGPPL